MPIGAFKLNSIARALSSAPAGRTAVTFTNGSSIPISTARSKIGTSSVLFSGGDQDIYGTQFSLAGNGNAPINFGTGNFTVEFWIYPVGTGTTSGVITKRNYSGTSNGTWGIYYNGSTRTVNWSNIFPSVTTTSTASSIFSLNAWSHWAFVRNSGTLKIYIDGVERASAANSLDFTFYSEPLRIGDWGDGSGNSFSGNLDEIRISDVARYTATFTPPTVAFANDANTLLLLHLEGANGSTTITDDTTTPTYNLTASGGTITTYTTGGATYNVHTFTSSSQFTVTSGSGTIDTLIVGGGGSGGRTAAYGMGGGGGGGQVRYETAVTAATSVVTIGTGGPGSTATPASGGATSAFGYSSAGGGAGGANASGNSGLSVTGGSGGGGGGSYTTAGSGGTGTYSGGNARLSNEAGGGGGGAGGAGQTAPSSGQGGTGGLGYGITDTFQSGTQYYAGGGGGGSGAGGSVAAGGSGVGGAGAYSATGAATTGGTATANTGSGGGGGYANAVSTAQNRGGPGSAGVVRVRYRTA